MTNLEQQTEIERLKREIDDLKRQRELEHEYAVAVYESLKITQQELAGLRETVNKNAKVANDNAKIDDQRWQAYLSHRH